MTSNIIDFFPKTINQSPPGYDVIDIQINTLLIFFRPDFGVLQEQNLSKK